jgi:hypothetical protein
MRLVDQEILLGFRQSKAITVEPLLVALVITAAVAVVLAALVELVF